MPDLNDLQNKLGYRFRNADLLTTALTHGSYAHAHDTKSYERLEFLGDSILGMCTADWLFRTFPDEQEGRLTEMRKTAVGAESLGRVCKARGYLDYLRCAKGACGKKVPSDVFEALIAAIYLDGGLNEARAFVERHLRDLLDCDDRDYRSEFKEAYEDGGSHRVEWRYDRREADGAQRHTAILIVDGKEIAREEAESKHAAERMCCYRVMNGSQTAIGK